MNWSFKSHISILTSLPLLLSLSQVPCIIHIICRNQQKIKDKHLNMKGKK